MTTMRETSAKFFVLVTCSCFLLASALHQPNPAGDNVTKTCVRRERDALLAFRQGITIDTYNTLASWQRGQDCCRWTGVTCSNLTGHVVDLDLGGANLVGQLIPSLLSLEYLEYLDLSWSSLEGPNHSVPNFLGSMKSLRHLDLSGMSFSGKLPSFLGNLSNLEYLDLSSTLFSGSVPPQLGNLSNIRHLNLGSMIYLYSKDVSWLSHQHLLEYLDMSYVNLSEAVDWPHVLNSVPSLEALYLAGCLLPSANRSVVHLNLTNLYQLDLSSNHFDHSIASCWFWNLSSMEYLDLSETNLYGPFPTALGRMINLKMLDFDDNGNTATMQVDIKDLCALEYLFIDRSLSSGNITDLMEKLPRCPSNKLNGLKLSGNNMTGVLPDNLRHLTSLVTLDLSINNITGAIPFGIGSCTSLVELHLSNNYLTGAIPPQIGNVTTLALLDLSDNHLAGAIPLEFGKLNSLEELYLSRNHLRHVPSVIGMLCNLTTLDLSYNNLNGVIKEEHLASLTRLIIIDLSYNSLKIIVGSEWQPQFKLEEAWLPSCLMGPHFPYWLKLQVGIQALDISNTGIVDKLPYWFFHTFVGIQYLDFSNNQISGILPPNLTAIPLQQLYISSNNLTGQIPLLPISLLKLDMSQNSLSGPLPFVMSAQNLMELVISSNFLTGHIPESICDLKELLVLDLSNNFLSGELPRCFRMPKIVFLLLSKNNFSGKFPSSLESCSNLAFLDLARNNFSGALPLWIGELVYLRFLKLSHNMIYGDIPVTITNLKRLQHLDLASNSISGAIPWSLSSLTAMARKHPKRPGVDMSVWYSAEVGNFADVISVVLKRQELKYGVEILEMVGIDLSLNNLNGGIPDEITTLTGLLNLNLSWNYLTGNIPQKIGDMKSVESLDLSRNNLSGEIPPSLSDLTYLSCLDLSFNNLTGTVPSGHQLDTLYIEDPYMYDGNSGLCGPPLQRNCSGNIAPENKNQHTSERDTNQLFFYLGLGSGYIAGLWVVFCALLFKKVWRIAYFRLSDKVYDKVYVYAIVTWGRITRRTGAD